MPSVLLPVLQSQPAHMPLQGPVRLAPAVFARRQLSLPALSLLLPLLVLNAILMLHGMDLGAHPVLLWLSPGGCPGGAAMVAPHPFLHLPQLFLLPAAAQQEPHLLGCFEETSLAEKVACARWWLEDSR